MTFSAKGVDHLQGEQADRPIRPAVIFPVALTITDYPITRDLRTRYRQLRYPAVGQAHLMHLWNHRLCHSTIRSRARHRRIPCR